MATVSLLLRVADAFAEPTAEDKALAATLFQDAKALLDANRVPEACRKLEESKRLYPAGGILLNLAVCHEREGRTASAWEEFREARARGERDQRPDRVELAEQHMQALEPRLSRLLIVVPTEVDVPGLAITIDGRAIGRAAWGERMPLDPESHAIEASAPGKRPWRMRVDIAKEGGLQTVTLPPWQDADGSAPPATPPPAIIAPSPTATPPAQQQPLHDEAPPARATSSRVPMLVAGTVGIMGVAVGTYFGALAISQHKKSEDACLSSPCSTASFGYNDASKSTADASTVAYSIGALGLALGAYFFFSHREEGSTSHVSIAPAVGPQGGSLDITGRF